MLKVSLGTVNVNSSSEIIRTDLSLKQRTELIEEACVSETKKEAHRPIDINQFAYHGE